MGCGCLLALAAVLSPRLAILLVWLLTDRMRIAFTSFWVAALGFVFLPWTALGWAVVYQPHRGVHGFGWLVVGLAFAVDVSTHLNGDRARRTRRDRQARRAA